MTKTLSFMLTALTVLPIAVAAQEAAPKPEASVSDPAPASASIPAPANPISTSEKAVYSMLSKGTVIAAAEKMPEEDYSFKPSPDVRSFGQLVGHVADSQYYFCSTAAGETNPAKGIEKSTTKKADLIAALKDAVAYCDKVYSAMTDAQGAQMTKLMGFNVARLTVLSANTAHAYEHYGNMVTYMRLKGIVPPTTERQMAQEKK